MTPCEEMVLDTIRKMAAARNGEAANVTLISRLSYVSLQHTRRCIRTIEIDQRIIRYLEPGKPARIIIKSKETNHERSN